MNTEQEGQFLVLEPKEKWPGEGDLVVKVHAYATLEGAVRKMVRLQYPATIDHVIVRGVVVTPPSELVKQAQRERAEEEQRRCEAQDRENYERLKKKFEPEKDP